MQKIASREIVRKLIHLSSLIYPLLYLVLQDRQVMLFLTGAILMLVLSVDVLRNLNAPFNILFCRWFGASLRLHERKQRYNMHFAVTGSTYFMAGVVLTIWLFPKNIAILAICVLIISDTCAALFGMAYGKSRLFGSHKSLEGFLAFLCSAGLISFVGSFYFQLHWLPLLLAVITTSLLELFSDKLKCNDNLLIPVSYGFTVIVFANGFF